MKKFYSKFANAQNWRMSVSNAIFKRNNPTKEESSSSESDDEDDSSQGSLTLQNDESSTPSSTSNVEGLLFRSVPDGESYTKENGSDNYSDSSDIYRIPNTSLTHSDEQPYQNIVDMSEELEKLKHKHAENNFIVTERKLSDNYDETNSEQNLDSDTTTEKYFECDTGPPSSERSSVERDSINKDPKKKSCDFDSESFGENYSENFIEGYSSKKRASSSEKEEIPLKLTPKKSQTTITSEYDIPRITFSFLDDTKSLNDNNYEILNTKPINNVSHTSATSKIVTTEDATTNTTDTDARKCRSEIRITLAPVLPPQSIENNTKCTSKNSLECLSTDNARASDTVQLIRNDRFVIKKRSVNKSKSHDNISILQMSKSIEQTPRFYSGGVSLAKSLTDFRKLLNNKTVNRKTIVITPLRETLISTNEQIYAQVNKKNKRQSVSLGNLEIESNSITVQSLENIQTIRVESPTTVEQSKSQSTDELEYCTARQQLSPRQVALVKKALIKNRAEYTWLNFRSKLNHMITSQAAAQRIGAQNETATSLVDEYPKAVKSVDKMYWKTKKKLTNLTKINERIFDKRKRRDKNKNVDDNESENRSENNSEPYDNSSLVSDEPKSKISNSMFKLPILGRKDSASALDIENKNNDFNTIKSAFRRSKYYIEGQNGFDDLRRYIKQGGDFCKELSSILQERSDAELQYAKSLSKLSNKLSRACRENVGSVNDAWKSVAVDMEIRAEVHRQFSSQLCEDIVKPLRFLTESQHKTRKNTESQVDKAARSLSDWRAAEAKSKKQSHASARDNEKLQDALLDARLSRSSSLIHLSHLHAHKTVSDKETAKLELKRRKAEDAVKKSDIEYYTLCVRAERSRLEWESAILRGSGTFQAIEEDRLKNLKTYLGAYLHLCNEMEPRILESTESLKVPIIQCDPGKDIHTFTSLRNSSQHLSEQLLPDFYCEHITLAMNRERRKQALIKLLQLIRQDLERERKSKQGLENLARAIKQTPNFGTDDSQQSVNEKMYHIRSMLTYLEGARYKVQNALAEIDNRQRINHPLAPHIIITRDKSGLQQSVLKVPPWLREEAMKTLAGTPSIVPYHQPKETADIVSDWIDRGMGDGNSNQPDSDFDEFSSQSSESTKQDGGSNNDDTIREMSPVANDNEQTATPICQCRALYAYTARLPDELSLYPGDILSVYRQQPDGWWLGECGGSVGIFPATYVEQINTS